jgi:hypothetical protein
VEPKHIGFIQPSLSSISYFTEVLLWGSMTAAKVPLRRKTRPAEMAVQLLPHDLVRHGDRVESRRRSRLLSDPDATWLFSVMLMVNRARV